MATVFDGTNLLITLDAPVAGVYELDVQRLYSEWKEWQVAAFANMGFPPAFRVVGGDALTPGINAGAYYFLRNDSGWRIKTTEEDQTVFAIGNLTPQDSSLPILVPTTGAFTVGVFGLQPITQSVAALFSLSQSAAFNGQVAIDTVNGASGTELPLGYATNPVNNLADAITIAAREGITTFTLKGSITLTQTFTAYTFQGLSAEQADMIALNGQNVDKTRFFGTEVSGAGTGVVEMTQCNIDAVSGVSGLFRRCGLKNNMTIAGDTTLYACFSEVAGNTKPWISMNSGAYNLSVRGYYGGFELRDCANASAFASVDGVGRFLAGATNTDGEIVIGGDIWKESTPTGGATLVDRTTAAQVAGFDMENGETMQDMMRLIRAAAAGKIVQQPDGTYVVRDEADSKDRIAGALGANNSRNITLVDSS